MIDRSLQLRSRLASELSGYIARHGWDQKTAAKRLKIHQPTVSNIINGHVEKISIDNFVKLFVRIGVPVTIRTRNAK